MGWTTMLLAALRPLLAALALGGAAAPPEGPARPGPVSPVAEARRAGPERLTVPASEVRSEWFQVQRTGDPDAGPVAVVRLVRLDAADHTLLERDIVWRAEGWRVHHTERLAGRARRLTWREHGPLGARAWTADWDLTDATGGRGLSIVGHGWARPTHERALADAPWIGALEWLEAARAGVEADLGPVAWLTPTRASSGVVRPAAEAPIGPRSATEVALVAGPEGRAAFAGPNLMAFDLGARDLVATPISEAEFARLTQLWAWRPSAHHPFVEAALRREQTLQRLAELGPSVFYSSQ